MEILSTVGIKVDYQTARDLFRQAGAGIGHADDRTAVLDRGAHGLWHGAISGRLELDDRRPPPLPRHRPNLHVRDPPPVAPPVAPGSRARVEALTPTQRRGLGLRGLRDEARGRTSGGQAAPLADNWSPYVFQVNDLPVGGWDKLEIGFDLMGPGEVLVDEVRVYDKRFNPNEQRELSGAWVALAVRGSNKSSAANSSRVTPRDK